MSVYDAHRIEKPVHFQIAPLRRGRGNRQTQVIGFDSEATHGRPFLLQFSTHGDASNVEMLPIRDLDEEFGALTELVRYVHRTCTRKDTEYIMVGWNLQYEFTQLFADLPVLTRTAPEFVLHYRLTDASGNALAHYTLKAMNDKRYAFTLVNDATKRRVRVIDGMAFYVTSLDKAAAMLDLPRKVTLCGRDHEALDECKRCEDRKRNLTLADLDDPAFMRYAAQDAYATRRIGEQIISLHQEYDVPTCVSAPHFAARVFRRHFLDGEIKLAEYEVEQAGLFSYHGGKNGYYLDGPKLVSAVVFCDITSAYPEAMRALPDPVRSTFVRRDAYVKGVHALWHVTGRYKACKYRGAQSHDGHWLDQDTYIDGVWMTSYEVDAMVSLGELQIIAADGWEMVGPVGDGALVRYVDRFFEDKRTSTGPKREAAKLFLNSLYGKFFQKVALGDVGLWEVDAFGKTGDAPRRVEHDPSQPFDYQAGGLYHPAIASLITGYVRGKIHRLEHRYNALMTSTDGFFATKMPPKSEIGKSLGMLTATRGSLRIWRERLYIFDAPNEKPKAALHGWHGSIDGLAAVPLRAGTYEYMATAMMTLKQAGKAFGGRTYTPGTFADIPFKLVLDTS